MSEVRRILDQMDRAFDGDAWHGPPLRPMFDGLNAEDASKHAIPGAHSIWEIVNHITAWNTIIRDELVGATVEITAEMDWPPVWDASEVEWRRAVQKLVDARSRLRQTVEQLRDEQLDERPCKRTSNSRYVMLHGIVQHDLYHAGQITLLKKAIQGHEPKMTFTAKGSAVAIRSPEPRDYPKMAELAGQLGYRSSAPEIERRLTGMVRSEDHAVFVAETADGKIAGWIAVFIYRCVESDPRAEISGLVVDESARSAGIGRRLLERAEDWARQKGCVAVGLRSNVIRERAHAFYERLGYEHIKTQKSLRKQFAHTESKGVGDNGK